MFRVSNLPVVFGAVLLAATASTVSAAPPARSVSTSRQFIVYGPAAALRGGVCDLAERTKRTALALLQRPDEWKTPIVISVQHRPANRPELPVAQLNVSQTGFGLKFQLELSVAADLNVSLVERELLRAIFLEVMYRTEPNTPAGNAYVEPPEWLLDGTIALRPGGDLAGIAVAFSAPLAANRILPIAEFLRQKPALLDSPSRVLYRAYAAALVSMLIEEPDGRACLTRYLADLPHASGDDLAEVQKHFPAIGDNSEKLANTWLRAVTRLATSDRHGILGCEETERQLAEMLHVTIGAPQQEATTYGLEEFPKFIRDPRAAAPLLQLKNELLLLSTRANPLYRPIVAEYQQIVFLLLRGKVNKLPKRLLQARIDREQMNRRMAQVGDYMNWFEATQAQTASGAFQDYMNAADAAAEREPRRRRDRISVYLDALEPEF